jgi:hypothetical protein
MTFTVAGVLKALILPMGTDANGRRFSLAELNAGRVRAVWNKKTREMEYRRAGGGEQI